MFYKHILYNDNILKNDSKWIDYFQKHRHQIPLLATSELQPTVSWPAAVP